MYSRLTAAAQNTLIASRTGFLIAASVAALTIAATASLAVSTGGTPPPSPSGVDLYAGYGYFHPVNSDINHNQYQPINPGAGRQHHEQYLIDEKGIDPTHIELRTGDSAGRSVDNMLVLAGATFNSGSTATFESTSVKRSGQPYGKPGAPKTTKKIRTKAN